MHVPIQLKTTTQTAEEFALLDTGATENFVSKSVLTRLGIGTQRLPQPRRVRNADGTDNRIGSISEFADLRVQIGNRSHVQRFYLIDIGNDRMILGYPWFARFEPKIRWATQEWQEAHITITTVAPPCENLARTGPDSEHVQTSPTGKPQHPQSFWRKGMKSISD